MRGSCLRGGRSTATSASSAPGRRGSRPPSGSRAAAWAGGAPEAGAPGRGREPRAPTPGAASGGANMDPLLHANAVELVANAAGTALTGVRAAALGGGSFAVRARGVVLAAGGIESPRLLLASNRVWKAGLGNGADLVGRFFMEH